MSYNSREVHADTDAVFAVLVDPHTYPAWLVGNAEVRAVDPEWPEPGSRFHHSVGVPPFTISDSSEVVEIEPGRLLRLKVRARPLIQAMATFRLLGDGARTVVSFEEEPAPGVLGLLARPLVDPLVHVRNQESLRRLAAYIESQERDRTTASS